MIPVVSGGTASNRGKEIASMVAIVLDVVVACIIAIAVLLDGISIYSLGAALLAVIIAAIIISIIQTLIEMVVP